MALTTFWSMALSSSVSSPAVTVDAVWILSFTISREFIPDRTQVTASWFHSQRKAHWAGVRPAGWAAKMSRAVWGRWVTSLPPRRGSMMMTGRPFSWAWSRPRRPAWECSSR